MKDRVKVSLVQFAPDWLQRDKNAERMKNFVDQEAENGAELIVFPELANVGEITPQLPGKKASFDSKTSAEEFAVKYIQASEPIPGTTTDLLAEAAKKWGVYVVVGISQLHRVVPAILYNSAALIGPSGVIGVHHKMHVPMNEKHYFYGGSTAEVYQTELGKIGMTVCYDGRFPELTRVLALKGAEIICSIVATPRGAFADPDGLKHRAYTRAQENQNYYLACNRTGKEGDSEFVGHSAIAKPTGDVIAYCDSEEETTLTAELFNEEILKARALLNALRDRRPDMYSMITEPLSVPYQYQQPESSHCVRRYAPDSAA